MTRADLVISALVSTVVLMLTACSGPKRDCDEFDEAELMFNRLADEIVDPDFQDPAFVAAAERFEAIPSQCKRHGRARSIAKMIRDGQQRRQDSEDQAADQKAQLGRSDWGGLPGEVCNGYVCTMKYRNTGKVYKTMCMRGSNSEGAAATACGQWVKNYGPYNQILNCFCTPGD